MEKLENGEKADRILADRLACVEVFAKVLDLLQGEGEHSSTFLPSWGFWHITVLPWMVSILIAIFDVHRLKSVPS